MLSSVGMWWGDTIAWTWGGVVLWWGDAIAWTWGGLSVLVHPGLPLRSLLHVMAHALIPLSLHAIFCCISPC